MESPAAPIEKGLWPHLVERLIHHRRLLLVAVALIVGVALPLARRVQLDDSIESMFPPGDSAVSALRESREAFGGDEFVLVAYSAGSEEELISQRHLNELKAFSDQLSAVPGVDPESTQNLAGFLQPDNADRGTRLFLRLPSTRNKVLDFSEGILVSTDRATTAIVLRLLPEGEAGVSREKTVQGLRELAAAHEPPAFVAGEPIQIADTFRYVEQDGALLGWASSLLLMVVIAILFRRLRWVLLPLFIVQGALVLTKATLFLLGIRLSMVSSVLTALVTIIGIATSMHVIVHYRALRKDGQETGDSGEEEAGFAAALPRPLALSKTLLELGPAIFWSCVTTAFGFLALCSSRIGPVQTFGQMMAIGTLCVLFLSFVLLPGGIMLGPVSVKRQDTGIDAALGAWLRGLATHLRGRGMTWLAFGLTALLVSAFGLTRLQVETDFSKNFRASSPIVRALEFFEETMGGAGTWEILLTAGDEFDAGAEERTRELAEQLRAIETPSGGRLTKVIAVTDGLDMIPGIARRWGYNKRELLDEFQPEFLPSMFKPAEGNDPGVTRILLRSYEQRPADEKLGLIAAVTAAARRSDAAARPTGMYVLLARIVTSLLKDQWTSFLLAGTGVFLAITFAFRSVTWGVIALLPNLLPISLVVGTIGWLGIPVNMGTAMIASVSMGLTVDSSIHYLAAYRRRRQAGSDHWGAIEEVHSSTGRALVFSHLALVGGFSVLALSNFVPLIYFGVLVSMAMFVGLFGVLVMLPMLLTLAERPSAKPEDASPNRVPVAMTS